MPDTWWIRLDRERLREGLSRTLNRVATPADVEAWLVENGLQPEGEGWLIFNASDFALFAPGEVLEGRSLGGTPERPPPAVRGLERRAGPVAAPMPAPAPVDLTPELRAAATIPLGLIGRHRDVVAHMRPVVRKAVKSGDWARAVEGVEFVSVFNVPGDFVMQGPSAFSEPNDVLLYVLPDLLFKLTEDADWRRHHDVHRRLVLAGLDHFWLCLVQLASSYWILTQDEREANGRLGLEKVLPWWPVFCSLRGRYSRKWPSWLGSITGMCESAGLLREERAKIAQGNPEDVEPHIRAWLLNHPLGSA